MSNVCTSKICRICKIPKPLDDFYNNGARKRNACKTCSSGWFDNNLEHIKLYQKEYRERNIVTANEKYKLRRKTDHVFRLKGNIRNLVKNSLTKQGFSKNTKTFNILGCTFEEFKKHIESNFEPWMNWKNYGLYNGTLNYGWDLDHVIPISSVNTEDGILKLNHFTNLQPLCSKINRDVKKQNKK